MNFLSDKVTEFFFLIDESCIQYESYLSPNLLWNASKRKPRMFKSEVITLMTLFHSGNFRSIKHFYWYYV